MLSKRFKQMVNILEFSNRKLIAVGGLLVLIGLLFLVNQDEVSMRLQDSHSESHGTHDETVVEISKEAIVTAKLGVENAESRAFDTRVRVVGQIVPNRAHIARIAPRYSGVAKRVMATLGDRVEIGQSLAIVESNGGLNPYPIKTRIAGTVIQKDLVEGEFVDSHEIIFTVADLRTVWVNLNVSDFDYAKFRVGQKVLVLDSNKTEYVESELTYLSPMMVEDSQTSLARIVLDNSEDRWRPGAFVEAYVIVQDNKVPVAVREEALQTFEGETVVFAKKNEGHYQAVPVVVGRSGGGWVEILHGLTEGREYVSRNSFVLKSELLKGSAGHSH